ncbi:MAG TPA: cupin domain-containing protein [Solirubrobacteraceae bacterium]
MPAAIAANRRFYNPIQQDAATFVETSAESGGERTVLEIELAPGGGNALHRHRSYAERFEVVSGRLLVEVGDGARALGPGDEAAVPVDTLHCFRNETDQPVTFRVTLTPGQTGFERSLMIGYGLAADGRCNDRSVPRDPYHLALLKQWSDIRLPGAVGRLEPLFALLARRARAKGIDRELVARYCA